MKLSHVLVLAPAMALLSTAALAAEPPPSSDMNYKNDSTLKKTEKTDINSNADKSGLTLKDADKLPPLDKKDLKFIEEASKANLAEIQFSQLAAGHSNNSDVVSFASTMIDDHSKANSALGDLARAKGCDVPGDITASQKGSLDKLNSLSGDKFDDKYVKTMVGEHKDAVKLFEKFSKNGIDPELKSWAISTLPTLQHHLSMAEQLQKDITKAKTASR